MNRHASPEMKSNNTGGLSICGLTFGDSFYAERNTVEAAIQ